ncbi:MBL fold metallo-hydrolase [Rhodococcus sp. IEGM 1379]|uniref:MBL fold metallo-hydrolase n=1 Tax=Rhodococcus sp. IEGM 1379 TaxID=3047086 RepID=UPI0024B84B71|nr:MBL fold metallo-hydrolase [Rhodococcus sp. IEGM 1379]MDI9916330.1 MBL fold metallo-hydrolase [Rhodococcus sp. IEGM 1379]
MNGAVAIGDGIFQIPVPITNNPLGNTLVYAMESPNGLILVDAGWGDDNGWQGLNAGLAEIGHSVTDIEGVVVTHFHPDHTGLCGRVREASGAWIAMHEDDHDLFNKMATTRDDDWMAHQLGNMTKAGAPEADREAFRHSAAEGDSPVGIESAPDRILSDNEIIALTGRGLRVVYTPGHTPGHVCFYLDDANVMFTGDHVLQKTTPHVGNFTYPLEERDGLADFFASLRRVQTMDITRGLGAHGIPIDSVGGRAGELIEHHEERLEHLLEAFADQKLTVWEVAAHMKWYKPWSEISPMGKTMALSEGAAHLRHLVAREQVSQVPDTDPALFVRTY